MSADTPQRSEILFVTDAQDCNPNGNPLADNRPRRDPETGQGIVTDVRLKRYLRDQLDDDGHGIYIKKMGGESHSRIPLALDVLEDVDDAEDIEDMEDVGKRFLSEAADVRYFGATLSFESSDGDEDDTMKNALSGAFPNQYQGPVQFLPARSLNEIEENDEYDSLTSVVATGEDNRQGGFGLDDKRIVYGIFPFYGLVDGESAKDTNLSPDDVRRLDTLCWRALKNQTTSRSKIGQAPRLYLRVQYSDDHFHVGNLHNQLDLDPGSDDPIRSVSDVTVDVTALIQILGEHADRIDTVRMVADDRLTLTDGESGFPASGLEERLETAGITVDEVDVYEERDLA